MSIEPQAPGEAGEPGLLARLGRGAWAAADQGLFAGGNFLLHILLARWLPAAEYGAFAVGFSAMVLLAAVHFALLAEPMLVYGPGKYRDQFHRYIGAMLWGHAAVVLPGAGVLAAAGVLAWVTGVEMLAAALLAFAAASPFVLLMWLLRRGSYIRLEPQRAAAGGAVYLVAVVVGVWLLERAELLTIASAAVVMGAASLIACIWLVLGMRPQLRLEGALLAQIGGEHWRFGRWGIVTGLLYFATGNLFYLVLPMRWGLDASGALRAMVNLITPIVLLGTAYVSVLMPMLVQQRGQAGFARLVRRGTLLLIAAAVVYWLVLGMIGREAMALLYADRYVEHVHLLWLLGLLLPATVAVDLLSHALRALERPKRVMAAYAISAAVAVVVGVPLVFLFGLPGAVGGMVLAGVSSAIVLAVFYLRARG